MWRLPRLLLSTLLLSTLLPSTLLPSTLLLCALPAGAQDANGLFLIAKPGLADPNFSRTVVLVTQTEDFSTVGVIVNRPGTQKLTELLADTPAAANYAETVYAGGPVLRQVLVSVFHAEAPPAAPAFHVLRTLYMSMHPDNLAMLLASPPARYRLYSGFSGWAPRQLESEFFREGWFVLPADEQTVFRADTSGLWEELVSRAQALKTGLRNK